MKFAGNLILVSFVMFAAASASANGCREQFQTDRGARAAAATAPKTVGLADMLAMLQNGRLHSETISRDFVNRNGESRHALNIRFVDAHGTRIMAQIEAATADGFLIYSQPTIDGVQPPLIVSAGSDTAQNLALQFLEVRNRGAGKRDLYFSAAVEIDGKSRALQIEVGQKRSGGSIVWDSSVITIELR